MTRFAINWSPEAADLLTNNLIQVDMYKCPEWPNLVADARTQLPAYVHFPLQLGAKRNQLTLADLEGWIEKTETLFVNLHVAPRKDRFAEDISVDDLSAILHDELMVYVNHFGAERVIIENVPPMKISVERGLMPQGWAPQLLSNLVASTGCGFLFDISHAQLTCEYTGDSFPEYVAQLPLHALREMHVTGIGEWLIGGRGDHVPLTASDWERFDWCIAQIQAGKWTTPDVIAFEHGGIGKLKDWCGSDKVAIAEQVPRLYQAVHSLNPQASAS